MDIPNSFKHSDENYAHWMRECLIHRLNQISGRDKDPEQTADETQFYLAQMETQKIRQRTTHLYHTEARARPNNVPPLWCYGAAFHHFFVTEGIEIKEVLKYSFAKMTRQAQKIWKQFKSDEKKAAKDEPDE